MLMLLWTLAGTVYLNSLSSAGELISNLHLQVWGCWPVRYHLMHLDSMETFLVFLNQLPINSLLIIISRHCLCALFLSSSEQRILSGFQLFIADWLLNLKEHVTFPRFLWCLLWLFMRIYSKQFRIKCWTLFAKCHLHFFLFLGEYWNSQFWNRCSVALKMQFQIFSLHIMRIAPWVLLLIWIAFLFLLFHGRRIQEYYPFF